LNGCHRGSGENVGRDHVELEKRSGGLKERTIALNAEQRDVSEDPNGGGLVGVENKTEASGVRTAVRPEFDTEY
jgi:hypothetical protein